MEQAVAEASGVDGVEGLDDEGYAHHACQYMPWPAHHNFIARIATMGV